MPLFCYTSRMREIEVKAKVRDLKNLLENAKQLGIRFGESITQEDVTYETALPKDDPDWNIFRIRTQGNKFILTMKYAASSRSRDNHERETKIEDAKEVADMLERVGYSFGVRIHKTRKIAKHRGLEICLDEIDELGTFIEVEKLADDNADVDSIQKELWELLVELGVDPKDRVHKGYDTLMHELVASKK